MCEDLGMHTCPISVSGQFRRQVNLGVGLWLVWEGRHVIRPEPRRRNLTAWRFNLDVGECPWRLSVSHPASEAEIQNSLTASGWVHWYQHFIYPFQAGRP